MFEHPLERTKVSIPLESLGSDSTLAPDSGFAIRKPRKLLSIAHSYVVALNRRLAHEMAVVGKGRWDVTAAAPNFFHGDLRPIPLEAGQNEACQLEGVPVRFSRKVQLMVYGSRLRKILRSQSWDLVHCWEEPYIYAAFQIARWTPRSTPLVFWTAQNLSKNYPPPFRWFERYCLNRSSGWLACGQSIVETMESRGYNARPHRIMPLGVDLDRFRIDVAARERIRTLLGWDESGPPVVGYMGRFVPEKGAGLLMRVLDRIDQPWRVLFLGGGPMADEIRSWAARYPGRVAVTSATHDEVPAYINAMDLLVAPSQTIPSWREQFGRMLTEAFACGVPVVASSSGEIPFVVADAGRIVPEDDENAWTATISDLLADPDLRAEYRERGLDRVTSHYTWPIVAKSHLEFFDEIVDSASRNAR